MEPWTKPILARVNGAVDNLFAAETVAIKRLWDEYNAILATRPTLEAAVMTPGQLAVLTRTAHMHGRTSEMTREILAAFGLAWGWPNDLPEVDRRFESQQVLVPTRPVPVAAPDPAPPITPVEAPPSPGEPVAVPTPTPTPLGAATVKLPTGFVEVPQPVSPPVPPVPDGRGERGRAMDSAVVVVLDDAPPGWN